MYGIRCTNTYNYYYYYALYVEGTYMYIYMYIESLFVILYSRKTTKENSFPNEYFYNKI